MRPVNLIPKEDRPGSRRPMRGGPIAYIFVGALVAALLGMTALVVTGNQISDLNQEIVQVEGEVSVAEAKASALASYTQFHNVREQRVATITSLADSRFDWERVMRELALVLPGNVWLTNLTATANPQVTPDGAATVALRTSVAGPALALIGCAHSQDAVAGFVQALKDIDGVTRVGVQGSSLGGASTANSGSSGSATCQTRDFIAQFQMVVAFDAAPVASAATATEAAPPVAAPAETESEGEG
jgi:Tfp pilus assembly protein PilN